MPILYNEKTREFHLYNDDISYIIKVLENEQPGQLYFGKKIQHREDFSHLFEGGMRDMAPYAFEGRYDFTLENIKQEYPTFGTGDMRYPAYEIEKENGSRVVDFQYVSHRIFSGKKKLDGLPATYVETPDDATTLELVLEDSGIRSTMILSYTIFEQLPVIARNVQFKCDLKDGITLQSAMSGCLDLPDHDYKLMTLSGAWARERHVHTRDLEYGIQAVYSMRGCSSHQHNPFLALMRKNATETSGSVMGFSLVYSGNFLAQVEVDNYDVTRVLMGIHPNTFTWDLSQGESFQTPEMLLTYSDAGLNGMSQTFHDLFRNNLMRGPWKKQSRPILINNWEATYFNFNEDKILTLAQKAKDIGIELFVLDDGWFGQRNDDTSSLGDWYPNLEKLPEGVTGLAQKVCQLGLQFGIWIEPEMVCKDSQLFREHLDWIFSEAGQKISHSRNQYVLDFSRQEVRDHTFAMIDKLLTEAPISYVKWDMNRSFSQCFSNGRDRSYQGKAQHKYILGVYEFYEKLITRHPDVLFESCASGGARFDPGMLYYAPQGWISDDTDAVERLKIQYGTSMVYPLVSMGSHVSASPNHQLQRRTSLKMRGDVAYFGTFGYELDLTKLPEEDLEEMKTQILFMKQYRNLIQQGTFYRLLSPFEGNYTAWMVVSADRKQALVGYYKTLQTINDSFKRLNLQGLLPQVDYTISEVLPTGTAIDPGQPPVFNPTMTCSGAELMSCGLIVSDRSSCKSGLPKNLPSGDFTSRIFELRCIE